MSIPRGAIVSRDFTDRSGPEPTPRTVENAREEAEQLTAYVIEMWLTAEDERVCPECGPLDGQTFYEFHGPMPPLHDRCRCQRVYWSVTFWSREL